MQEKKSTKGSDKILLISIFTVIAVLLLLAGTYFIFRGDNTEPQKEVNEEVVQVEDKVEEDIIPEEDDMEKADVNTGSCREWRYVDFAENDKEAGSVNLTGSVITKVEDAPFVENKKVTNVYLVISNPSTETQKAFYDYYITKVENGNTVNDVDEENLLFKLGILEESELISTADMSEELKDKILSNIDTENVISLRLTIPKYDGTEAPAEFSFACEVMEGVQIEVVEDMGGYLIDWDSLDNSYGYPMDVEEYSYIIAEREQYCPTRTFNACAEDLDENLLRASGILLEGNEILIDMMTIPSGFCPGMGFCNPVLYSVLDLDLWEAEDPNAYHIYMLPGKPSRYEEEVSRIDLNNKFDLGPLIFSGNGEGEVYELLDATYFRAEESNNGVENYFFQKHKINRDYRSIVSDKNVSVYNLSRARESGSYSLDKVLEGDNMYNVGTHIQFIEGGIFERYLLVENCLDVNEDVCIKNEWKLFDLRTLESIKLFSPGNKNRVWAPVGYNVDINNKNFVLSGRVFDFGDGDFEPSEIFGEFGIMTKDYEIKDVDLPLLDNIDKGLGYSLSFPYETFLGDGSVFVRE